MNLTAFTLNPAQSEGYGSRAATTLLQLSGVKDVLVGSPNQVCSVIYEENRISPKQLLEALDSAGFTSEVLMPKSEERQSCCGGCS